MVVTSGAIASADAPVPAPATAGCTQRDAGTIGGAFINPYAVYGASAAELDAMFARMKSLGMDTAVVQWTGFHASGDTYSTTYDGTFDRSLDRLIAAAGAANIKVWLGLVVHPNLLDQAATNSDSDVLDTVARLSIDDATRLQQRYSQQIGGTIAGWYIPTEPGLQSVNNTGRRDQHMSFFRDITSELEQLTPGLPVLGSPATSRATFEGHSGVWFMENFEPFFADSGVDVWALQDGFEMTSWTATDNRALIETGRDLAAQHGVSVWADVFTPSPEDRNTTSTDATAPYDPWSLQADLDALAATGVPIVTYAFDAMDTSRAHDLSLPGDIEQRAALADSYWNYCVGQNFTH